MADEDPPNPPVVRVAQFRPRIPSATLRPILAKGEKWSLYPLVDDVLISKPLFSAIIVTLRAGSPDECKALAQALEDAYAMPFV